MTEFEQVLMNRDGLSRAEAKRARNEKSSEIYECLEQGGSYSDVEELLLDEGLEMDYIFDLL